MIEIKIKKMKTFIIMLFFTFLIYFVYLHKNQIKNVDIDMIKNYIISYGSFSAIVFILMYSLKPIVFIIPASLLSIMAANIYGPFIGFLLSMISCFFAGTLAFFLSRMLGKDFIEKLLKGKALKLDNDIEKHGFIIMLLMRLSFVFPYDALSYAGGLTKMKYSDFILGTLLGVIPEMITYSLLGSNFGNLLSSKIWISFIVTILIASTSYFIYKKHEKQY